MSLLERVLQIHESESPRDALRALAGSEPVRSAIWVSHAGERIDAWPESSSLPLPPDPLSAPPAAPEIRPGPDGAELLVLPLPDEQGALILTAERGAFGPDPAAWLRAAEAFARLARRARRIEEAEEEVEVLRQRAEESEALHVLGLAANRSLDPDEVLDLVSRFTRTLLGGHYVTISTVEDEGIRTIAAIGLRSPRDLPSDDPFAARVIESGKPVIVGQAEEDSSTPRSAFHDAEGMRAGLGVPLSLYGNTFGALVIGYRRPYGLESRDTRLALTLAGHAAVAISNARFHRDLADRSRELERAYEELRWTSQAKERFFASMSHELRTPLNAILGYQSLLLDGIAGPLADPQRSFIESAHRATQALLLLVNDVLDLSKIQAGKMELFVRSTPLAEIIREALATIRPMADTKGIGLRVPPLDELPVLETDADRVRQILLNLLSNAVKFTDRGLVSITVETERPFAGGFAPVAQQNEQRAEEWIEIRISDTGPGISSENHERIFHEFEQVVGAAARGGTGLGLPISRKLARLLGGDLRVESAPGAGSTFALRLPWHIGTTLGTRVAEEVDTA